MYNRFTAEYWFCVALYVSLVLPVKTLRFHRSNPSTPTQPRRPDFIGIAANHHQPPQYYDYQQTQNSHHAHRPMMANSQNYGSPQRRFMSEGELVRQEAQLSYPRSNNTVDNIRELANSPQRGVYMWKDTSPGYPPPQHSEFYRYGQVDTEVVDLVCTKKRKQLAILLSTDRISVVATNDFLWNVNGFIGDVQFSGLHIFFLLRSFSLFISPEYRYSMTGGVICFYSLGLMRITEGGLCLLRNFWIFSVVSHISKSMQKSHSKNYDIFCKVFKNFLIRPAKPLLVKVAILSLYNTLPVLCC